MSVSVWGEGGGAKGGDINGVSPIGETPQNHKAAAAATATTVLRAG